jgi:hypothetical protein
MVDTIFVSIASFRDAELTNTVYSLLSKAKNLSRIHVCILSQDDDDKHPKLESLFELFNTDSYTYKKVHYSESTGVGYARGLIQSFITKDHDFFLQVDSHSQFSQDWDERLILDYKKCQEFWEGDIIISSYPHPYVYDNFGNIDCIKMENPTVVKAILEKGTLRYACKYREYVGGEFGMLTGYFCAGMAFGKSELFLNTPYDQNIYFNGEEQTLSIRFYEKGVKIVAPPSNYIYHDYDGKKRKRQWDGSPEIYSKNDQDSFKRIEDFYECKISDPLYSVANKGVVDTWANCFVDFDYKES